MLRIDLYTELTCPWCLVGMHRLDKVLAQRFPGLAVDIRHHPVLLMPEAPATGLYIPDLLRSRYGIADPKLAFARPEAEARASGLALDLGKQLWAYPTQAAHALVLAAADRGTQHRLAVAIARANFLDGRNIADAGVLANIASAHGFTGEEALGIVRDPDWKASVEREAGKSVAAGIRSVPHFVFDGNTVLSGGRSEDEITACITERNINIS